MSSENKKNILIFSLVYYPNFVGGAEVAVKEITDRIGKDEASFFMVTMRTDRKRVEQIGNITVHRVGPYLLGIPVVGKVFFQISKYLFPFQSYMKAKRLQKQIGFDSAWAIMANYAGFGALFFKQKYPQIRFILTLQEGDPISYIKRRVALVYPLWKSIFTRADTIQAISTYLADFGKSMEFRGTPVVIPNAVDVGNFVKDFDNSELAKLESDLGTKDDQNVIVTTSRLVKKNGVGDIIESLKYLPENFIFLVLGNGPLENDLKLKADSLHLKARVVFLGYVPHSEMPKYLKISDVFVRPSLSEGLGNSFLEAMAISLPVVATSVGGIPDFLKDGETGYFCEVENPKSIAEAIMRFENNPEQKNRIIENAKKMVIEKYDWNLIAGSMKEILIK